MCYHPVPVGEAERSFETLTQDLALMKDMGINTIRVYEPIASKAVLDEIHAAGISVIVGWGTTKVASSTCSPGRTSTT